MSVPSWQCIDEALEQATAEVLELLCFAIPDEGNAGAKPPLEVEAVVCFKGPWRGALRIQSFGQVIGQLAEGMLPTDDLAAGEHADAWGEVANVLCGTLLHAIHPEGLYDLQAPSVSASSQPLDMVSIGSCVVDVEGGVVTAELLVDGGAESGCRV